MDKDVIAAVRQLENTLDTAISHCNSIAELNAYFIMEQKVWGACGTCAQDLFWAKKSQQCTYISDSTKTEAAPEAEIQEQQQKSDYTPKHLYIDDGNMGFSERLQFGASKDEIERAMKKKRKCQKKCKAILEEFKSR